MDLQCIALDLDRTTLNAQGILSEGNRRALEAAMARGIHIVIASGRPFGALPADVVSVPGIEYAITSNGAAIYHIPTQQRLHSYAMEPHTVREVLRLSQDEPLVYETFVEGIAYMDANLMANPAAYGFGSPQSIHYLRATRHSQENIRQFIEDHIHELDSMDLVFWDRAVAQRVTDRLREQIPDLYMTSTIWQLLELSHREAGKHSGVRWIAEHLSLSPDQIAAFGDGDNDVEMLQYVGCGIAMENASPTCLAAADQVAGHHDRDGVAQEIYRLLSQP